MPAAIQGEIGYGQLPVSIQEMAMLKPLASDQPDNPADDFQRAAAAAEMQAGKRVWSELQLSERSRVIYAQLRRIDADRAVTRRPVNKAAR
jgi:hypothetical protein